MKLIKEYKEKLHIIEILQKGEIMNNIENLKNLIIYQSQNNENISVICCHILRSLVLIERIRSKSSLK